jgi:hypothetical protein
MRNPARRQYLHHYNAQANHDMLIEIYRRAIAIRTGKPLSSAEREGAVVPSRVTPPPTPSVRPSIPPVDSPEPVEQLS